MHEWMTDNHQTPHLVVDASVEGVVVPRQYVKDGRIILNVSYDATGNLRMDNDEVSFSARFGGSPMAVSFPLKAVLGIYARESGEGMLFGEDEEEGDGHVPPPEPSPEPPRPGPGRSHLKVIK